MNILSVDVDDIHLCRWLSGRVLIGMNDLKYRECR